MARADMGAFKAALSKTEKGRMETIAKYLEKQAPAIREALPGDVDEARFRRIVLTEVRRNPALLACEPISLIAACMEAAQLGLEVGSTLGEAYLIPRKVKGTPMVCFQKGYKGVRKLIANSPHISAAYAKAVYEGDVFEVYEGTRNEILHVPKFETPQTKQHATHVYAVAFVDGMPQFEVMTAKQVEEHRRRYVRAEAGPWTDEVEWVQMAKKTVFLRLASYLPLSATASRALAQDETVKTTIAPDMTVEPSLDEEVVDAEAVGAVSEEVAEDGDE